MGLSIKPVHEYCSKCGALKLNKNAEVCQTANCGNNIKRKRQQMNNMADNTNLKSWLVKKFFSIPDWYIMSETEEV